MTALLFTAVPWQIMTSLHVSVFGNAHVVAGSLILAILWTIVFVLFTVLAIIDLKHMIIPDFVNASIALCGVAIAGVTQWIRGFDGLQGSFLGHYAMLFGLRDVIWINHLFAAFIGLLFFGSIIVLSRGRAMGWGDFKLAGALGLLFGWPDVVLVFALAFIIGSIVSIGLLLKRQKHMKDAVPFGPFLVIGAAIVFFFGFRLVSMYFGLFTL